VILLGPAHFVPLFGTAVPAADAWATPLGEVAVDAELKTAAAVAGAVVDDDPHQPEHSLEVQLPFLQRSLEPGFSVLPIAVGRCAAEEVAGILDALAAGPLIVCSTDLSHYNDIETARELDRRTADAVLARDHESIGQYDACGCFALNGLLEFARRSELEVFELDLRTSGDTAGDGSRVVGYGAFALA
jgi:hypothetical protein